MVKFEKLLLTASPRNFRFIDQSHVSYVDLHRYSLSKRDVISAIKLYIKRIYSYTDKSIRCEGMIFSSFKMSDLVPYLYTLINLYLHVRQCDKTFGYSRTLPELKLTRFCYLPFEDEIILS